MFSIDKFTGKVFLNAVLDREKTDRFRVGHLPTPAFCSHVWLRWLLWQALASFTEGQIQGFGTRTCNPRKQVFRIMHPFNKGANRGSVEKQLGPGGRTEQPAGRAGATSPGKNQWTLVSPSVPIASSPGYVGGDGVSGESRGLARSHQWIPLDSQGWTPGKAPLNLPLRVFRIERSERKGNGEGNKETQSPHLLPLSCGPHGSHRCLGITVSVLALCLTSYGPLLWTWEDPPWRSPQTWRLWLWIRTTTGPSSSRRCSLAESWRVPSQVRQEPGHPAPTIPTWEGLWVGQKFRIFL